jgi:NitT/TauT family transport system permease protein
MQRSRLRLRIRLRPRELAITTGVLAGVCAFALFGAMWSSNVSEIPGEAPGLVISALLSLSRMTAAFAISLVVSVVYGLVAATRPQTRAYLLPLLDIGQSIPIPALFPVVLVVFIKTVGALVGSPRLGVELACIFLIFSVQVWNIAFSVYEGITQIPEDLRLAADSFGLSPAKRLVRLYLPACIPKIVYNSIASWANGWYFLTLCEVLDKQNRVEGIGSYLADAINPTFLPLPFIAGLSLIFVIVFAMEFLVWRPLTAWSRKFRYDVSGSESMESETSFVLDWWRRSRMAIGIRALAKSTGRRLERFGRRTRARLKLPSTKISASWGPRVAKSTYVGFFCVIGALTIAGVVALVVALARPWPESAATVPIALVKSTLRIAGAYVLTLAWTVPLALWVARNPRLDRYVTPTAEILAAVPAVAVWPLLARGIQPFFGSNATAIAMLMTGMQWYLLFNLIEGVKRIPSDLMEASRSIGLRGMHRARQLFIPSMMPAVVTGSVTAWGGGWNALTVAERFAVGNTTYECDGLGARLMESSGDNLDPVSLALNMIAMLLAVAILNRVVWHRLYDYAESRFRFD